VDGRSELGPCLMQKVDRWRQRVRSRPIGVRELLLGAKIGCSAFVDCDGV